MSPRLKVCPYYARRRVEGSKGADPKVAGGIQFLPAPPSGAESTVSPILMYLLHPSLPVGFSFGLPVLPPFISHYESQLLGIQQAREKEESAQKPRPSGPLVSRPWRSCTVLEMSQVRTGVSFAFPKRRSQPIVAIFGSPPRRCRCGTLLCRRAIHARVHAVIYASPFSEVDDPRVNA